MPPGRCNRTLGLGLVTARRLHDDGAGEESQNVSDRMWNLPGVVLHHHSASAGPLTFVGGAGDFDAMGRVRNPWDLDAQAGGAVHAMAQALATEWCTLEDVVRIKAYYTAEVDDWSVIAALVQHLPGHPLPAISTVPEPLQPFEGQVIQLQAIACRGWRGKGDVRVSCQTVPVAVRERLGLDEVTAGLRAGEFIAVANRAALDDAGGILSADPVEQSHAVMDMHERTLDALGASLQDSVKMEGYYFGTSLEDWAPLARARASHFREPGPPATVVPCHRLHPQGARTKIGVLAMRARRGGFDKYIPRLDVWPDRVWDWPIPLPYRQAICLRDTIWLGGQVPHTPFTNDGGRVMSGDLVAQTRFTMSFVEDLLRGFDRRPADLKLMVCYFTRKDAADTDAVLDTLATAVGGALPPITLVPKPMMHSPENTVEIWGVAQG